MNLPVKRIEIDKETGNRALEFSEPVTLSQLEIALTVLSFGMYDQQPERHTIQEQNIFKKILTSIDSVTESQQ